MLHSFAGARLPAEQDAVPARGRRERKLVKSQHLTTSSHDAGPGAFRNAEGRHAKLGNIEQAGVISDRAHNRRGLPVFALHELGQFRQRKRRAVSLAHVETTEDHGVELGVGAAREELVELFLLLKFFF